MGYGIDCKKPFTQKHILVYESIKVARVVSIGYVLLLMNFCPLKRNCLSTETDLSFDNHDTPD